MKNLSNEQMLLVQFIIELAASNDDFVKDVKNFCSLMQSVRMNPRTFKKKIAFFKEFVDKYNIKLEVTKL
jgi:hypothetical protein